MKKMKKIVLIVLIVLIFFSISYIHKPEYDWIEKKENIETINYNDYFYETPMKHLIFSFSLISHDIDEDEKINFITYIDEEIKSDIEILVLGESDQVIKYHKIGCKNEKVYSYSLKGGK